MIPPLPTSWVEASLDDLAVEAQSGFPSGRHNAEGLGIPHLRPMNIDRLGYIDLSEMKYVEADRDLRIVAGDVLFNNTNSPALIGKTAYFDRAGEWAFSNHMTRLRPPIGVEAKFLALQLHYLWTCGLFQQLCSHHVNQASVATKVLLQAIRMVVPPTAEQLRIVAAIEEQFSRLEVAERSLHGARRKLEALRRTILLHAVDGEWHTRPLGEVLVSLRNGIFVSRPASEPPGIPIFRISAVRPLTLAVDDVRFADIDPAKADGYFVQEGDLLFTRYSGNPDYVGACACVNALPRPTLHPDKLIRVVVDRSVAEPGFIAIALSIGPGRRAIELRRKTTAGQVGIAGSELKKVPVPIPPLDEQRRIIAEVERQLSIVAVMAAEVDHALRRTTALRRSILERAFSGKLVSQDPSEEPASVLLERIESERGPASTPSRRKTRIQA